MKMAAQNLLKLLMMRNVLTTVWCSWKVNFGNKVKFCLDFEDKVSRFVQDFEVDVQARF